MSIIKLNQGCMPKEVGCFGPVGDFYTIFGVHTQYFAPTIIVSVIIGIIFFSFLYFLKKKDFVKVATYFLGIVSFVITFIIFVLLLMLFNSSVS